MHEFSPLFCDSSSAPKAKEGKVFKDGVLDLRSSVFEKSNLFCAVCDNRIVLGTSSRLGQWIE